MNSYRVERPEVHVQRFMPRLPKYKHLQMRAVYNTPHYNYKSKHWHVFACANVGTWLKIV